VELLAGVDDVVVAQAARRALHALTTTQATDKPRRHASENSTNNNTRLNSVTTAAAPRSPKPPLPPARQSQVRLLQLPRPPCALHPGSICRPYPDHPFPGSKAYLMNFNLHLLTAASSSAGAGATSGVGQRYDAVHVGSQRGGGLARLVVRGHRQALAAAVTAANAAVASGATTDA
jgi:hypothetical protein